MNSILIFRHAAHEGPGYLAEVLDRHTLPYRVIAIDQGEAIPPDLRGVSALVFMGGPMSVNDPLPWIEQELHLIRLAAARNVPVLGHCLGGQLIAKALGAKVSPNRAKEIGWYPVSQAGGEVAADWLKALPHRFEVFHWHGETFTLPPGATRLLGSEWCANQAFALGAMLALQCHIEMTAAMVREWTAVNCEEIASPSPSVQSAAEMARDLETRIAQLQKIADVIYARWLRLIRAE